MPDPLPPVSLLLVLLLLPATATGATLDIRTFGASAGDTVGVQNRDAFVAALNKASVGDTVLIPKLEDGGRFLMMGGANRSDATSLVIQLDGVVVAANDIESWPKQENGKDFQDFWSFPNCKECFLVGNGLIDGQGKKWWNRWILDPPKGRRPYLVIFRHFQHLTVRNITMHDSPSYHLMLQDGVQAEVGHVTIHVDREEQRKLKKKNAAKESALPQPEDLNTDGIDVSGTGVWIHDCNIQNDDDSIAVKPCDRNCKASNCSENMLFERLTLTGVGATIGSVPPTREHNCVRNITFRNVVMPETMKGIYIKSNPYCQADPSITGSITDILYENMRIIKPIWWAIWIGPQQQHEPGTKLGRKCALDFPIDSHCPTQGCVTFRNITLKNIYIDSPELSPGVIKGNETNPMQNVVFDNVTVVNPGTYPFDGYSCEYADVTSVGCNLLPVCKTTP